MAQIIPGLLRLEFKEHCNNNAGQDRNKILSQLAVLKMTQIHITLAQKRKKEKSVNQSLKERTMVEKSDCVKMNKKSLN